MATSPETLSVATNSVLWTDGASRNNPGHAGIGVVLKTRTGGTLARVSAYIGTATSVVAEYQALLVGLDLAVRLEAQNLEVWTDSELIVKQLSGEYRVRAPHLRPLYDRAKQLLRNFSSFQVRHLPREENVEADQLANEGIDRYLGSQPVLDQDL